MRKFFSNIFFIFNFLLFFKKYNLVFQKSDYKVSETELTFTGMFDFSDPKQKSGLFGLQHQNEDLFRETFLGKNYHQLLEDF